MLMSLELFFLSIIMFNLGVNFFNCNKMLIINWDIVFIDFINLNYYIYLNWKVFLFMSVMLLISSMILMYSFYYVDEFKYRFIILMLMFIFSMVFLIISPNLLSMILGWDGLGIVSFCLINFFYNSNESVDNSMVTLLFNRFGDGLMLANLGLVYLYYMSEISMIWDWGTIIYIIMYIYFSTKSAQFPFSSWLPKAMSAPTPVSSLVHSSTLVTAGVYMIMSYMPGLFYEVKIFGLLSVLTMFYSGICALFSYDLKKIVAYSTLSQLGLMMFSLYMGLDNLCFFHMLTHAVFKSMMFMCAGSIIHGLLNNQDIRFYGGVINLFPLASMILLISLFSLMGMPFFSGFYSKDEIIESLANSLISIFMGVIYVFSLFISLLYSFRLMYYMFMGNYLNLPYINLSDFISVYMLVLMLFSLFLGHFFVLLFFSIDLNFYVGFMIKIFIIILLLFVFIYFKLNWLFLLYVNLLMMFDYSYLYKYMKFKMMTLSHLIYDLDSFWSEFYVGENILSLVSKYMYKLDDFSIYYMFMFILFLFYLLSMNY